MAHKPNVCRGGIKTPHHFTHKKNKRKETFNPTKLTRNTTDGSRQKFYRITIPGHWWLSTDLATGNFATGKKVKCKAHVFVKIARCKGCPRKGHCADGFVKYALQSELLSGVECALWYTHLVAWA